MISLPLGLIVMAAVFGYTLADTRVQNILNIHALVIVGFGTLGVLALSTPLKGIAALFRAIAELRKPDRSQKNLHQSLIDLSKRRDATLTAPHPLVAYAQQLWTEGVENETVTVLLTQRLDELNGATEQAVAIVRNLAKYPPALGMTGTVIGLISLFSGLTLETRDRMGPALALAMSATFYGLVLANALLMPLADRLHVLHIAHSKLNDHVYQTLLLIQQGEPQSVIEEELDVDAA